MKKRILIVEDDVTIQAQLKTLLTGNGYDTFGLAVVWDGSLYAYHHTKNLTIFHLWSLWKWRI